MSMILEDWVEEKIHLIFQEIAEAIGSGEIEGMETMTPNEIAGIPIGLTAADMTLTTAWRNWLARLKED